jgi:hypothetical protein
MDVNIRLKLDNEHRVALGEGDNQLEDIIVDYCRKTNKVYSVELGRSGHLRCVRVFRNPEYRQLGLSELTVKIKYRKVSSVETEIHSKFNTIEIERKKDAAVNVVSIQELLDNYKSNVRAYTYCSGLKEEVFEDQAADFCRFAKKDGCNKSCHMYGFKMCRLDIEDIKLRVDYRVLSNNGYSIFAVERIN